MTNKGKIDTFIETRTDRGDGVQCAIGLGFKKVLSCDTNRENAATCSKTFAKQDGVSIYHFTPGMFLDAVKDVYDAERCFFWLDVQDLNLDPIAKSKIKNHSILVDGIDDKTLKPTVDALRKINPKYEIFRYNTITPGRLMLARVKEEA